MHFRNASSLVKGFRIIDVRFFKGVTVEFFRCSSRHILRRKEAQFQKQRHSEETSSPILSQEVPKLIDTVKYNGVFLNKTQQLQANEKKFRNLAALLQHRKRREEKRKILLEGPKLIEAALNCGIHIEELFYSKEDALYSLNACHNLQCVPTYEITDRIMVDLMGFEVSPEIVAICEKPALENIRISDAAIPVTVVCSDIRDPSNMASILTLVAAAGCKRLLLMKGCVDVWERKVLSSANGVHFHIPIINNISWLDIHSYIPKNSSFYVADSSSDIYIDETQIYTDITDKNTYQNQINSTMDNLQDEINTDDLILGQDQTEMQTIESLPCKLYTEISFPNKELVLYIGGETVGINPKVQNLAHELQGQKIKLPLENGMDSLNVTVALTIILYEMKRQFTKKCKVAN